MELSQAIEETSHFLDTDHGELTQTTFNALCMVNTAARVLLKIGEQMRKDFGNQPLT